MAVSLPPKKRTQAINICFVLLPVVRGTALALQNAHWRVLGPQFTDLHKLFGKLYEHLDDATDVIAERITQYGDAPPVEITRVVLGEERAGLKLCVAIVPILEQTGDAIRAACTEMANVDPVFANKLQEVVLQLEKLAFFVEAHTK